MKNLLYKTSIIGLAFASLTMGSCKKDEPCSDTPPQTDPAITLSCGDFKEGVVLSNNPNAAIDYIIDCKVGIQNKLTIESGTVLEFT